MKKNLGIGTRIRQWRKSKIMKSFELAKMLRISQGSLSDIENNKSHPSATTIIGFINYTTIDIFWMLTGVEGEMTSGDIPEENPPHILTVPPGVTRVLIKIED